MINLGDTLKKFNLALSLLSVSIFTLTAHAGHNGIGSGRNDTFQSNRKYLRDMGLRIQEIRNHNVDVTNLFVRNYNQGSYPWLPYEIIVPVHEIMWDNRNNGDKYDLTLIITELYNAVHNINPKSIENNLRSIRLSN